MAFRSPFDEPAKNPITYKQAVDNIIAHMWNTMADRARGHDNLVDDAKMREYYYHVLTSADRKRFDAQYRHMAHLMGRTNTSWSKQEMIRAWMKDMWRGNWRSKTVPPFLANMP